MQKRMVYLDALRSLAMVWIVLSHSGAPLLVDPASYGRPGWYVCIAQDMLNRMTVPLFFAISGCLLLNRASTLEVGRFYKKHLPKLAIPLVVWNVVYYLSGLVRTGQPFQLSELLAGLLRQGVSSHLWFVYLMLGFYLLFPFLKRMLDSCTDGQLLLLIGIVAFGPSIRPALNALLPVELVLFPSLVEGNLGYVLLGCLLGRRALSPKTRRVVYALGVAGYLIGVLGNLASCSPEAIVLPFDSGYSFQHYFTCAAIFVWVRTLFEKHEARLAPAARPLAWFSDRTFGIYWSHVLVLEFTMDLSIGGWILPYVWVRFLLSLSCSLAFSAAAARIPLLRRLV